MPQQQNERDALPSSSPAVPGGDLSSLEWEDYRRRFLGGPTEHVRLPDMIRVVGGQADDSRRDAVLKHLKECADCKNWFDAYQRGRCEHEENANPKMLDESLVAAASRGLKAKGTDMP